MEAVMIALQVALLIAGTTLAQDFSSGFQPSFQPQQRFQQQTKERGPTRLLSQTPSAVKKNRPVPQDTFRQPQNTFQQPQNTFQQPQNNFQQPQNTFRQPQQTFQQPQQTFQQDQPSFRQPQTNFQQDPPSFQQPQNTLQSARAPPPPPPPPRHQPQPQQTFFEQPAEESFQAPPQPQQQIFEQPRESFRQPSSTPTPQRKPVARLSTPVDTRLVDDDAETLRQQAMNAKYAFAAGVTDGISDNQHLREEVRDGLALKGMYSYSDGYFRRTVHYEADENGYRVTNEETEPIGNGPQEDPNGRADVELHVTPGQQLSYSVTTADFQPKVAPQPSQALGQFSSRRPLAPRRQQQQQQQPQEFEQQQFQ